MSLYLQIRRTCRSQNALSITKELLDHCVKGSSTLCELNLALFLGIDATNRITNNLPSLAFDLVVNGAYNRGFIAVQTRLDAV